VKIEGFIWLDEVADKLAGKHRVSVDEVEAVFEDEPKFRFVEKGHRKGEDIYMALGRTEAGRYLAVLFILKLNDEALTLSARDMAHNERKHYGRK